MPWRLGRGQNRAAREDQRSDDCPFVPESRTGRLLGFVLLAGNIGEELSFLFVLVLLV
jgi:hypothetical protein